MDRSLLLYANPLNAYYTEDGITEEKDNCIVPLYLWQRWIERQTTEVLLVEIKQREYHRVLCVDSYHSGQADTIYIPSRYMMDFVPEEYLEVKVLNSLPPIATRIVLEPLESESHDFDIASATSEYLSHWNVLTKGAILTVPVSEIAGYFIDIYVKNVEPADTVLLRGEVPLEIEGQPQPEPQLPQPQPPQPQPQVQTIDDFDSMIPQSITTSAAFSGPGRRLGRG